jgi:hypothetical protein
LSPSFSSWRVQVAFLAGLSPTHGVRSQSAIACGTLDGPNRSPRPKLSSVAVSHMKGAVQDPHPRNNCRECRTADNINSQGPLRRNRPRRRSRTPRSEVRTHPQNNCATSRKGHSSAVLSELDCRPPRDPDTLSCSPSEVCVTCQQSENAPTLRVQFACLYRGSQYFDRSERFPCPNAPPV